MLIIIILSWNVRDLLRACLRSVEQHPATTHAQHVIVVDNASSDDSAAMVQREFPHATLVKNATNRGFSGGNNDGIRAGEELFSARGDGESYILLLNPDTEALPGALDALLACANANPDAGLIGPQLLHADGAVQSSRRRFPTLRTALFESTWLQRFAPRGLLESFYMLDRSDDETCDVDWVYGAAMLARRAAYLQCGILDEQTFFMYSEEVDWCKRFKAAGWRVVYAPEAKVIHHEGRSSAQVSARRMIHFNTSKARYFRKHHGAAQAFVLRAALLGMFAGQLLLEAAKWLAGHRRALRAQRVRAYAEVLRSGLR